MKWQHHAVLTSDACISSCVGSLKMLPLHIRNLIIPSDWTCNIMRAQGIASLPRLIVYEGKAFQTQRKKLPSRVITVARIVAKIPGTGQVSSFETESTNIIIIAIRERPVSFLHTPPPPKGHTTRLCIAAVPFLPPPQFACHSLPPSRYRLRVHKLRQSVSLRGHCQYHLHEYFLTGKDHRYGLNAMKSQFY